MSDRTYKESRRGHIFRRGMNIEQMPSPIQDPTPKRKKQQMQKDTQERIQVNSRIIELKKNGFSKERVLETLKTEYPTVPLNYLTNCVEQAYKDRPNDGRWQGNSNMFKKDEGYER